MELKREEISHNQALLAVFGFFELGEFGYLVPTTPSSNNVQ
jgi:hypothetical protein